MYSEIMGLSVDEDYDIPLGTEYLPVPEHAQYGSLSGNSPGTMHLNALRRCSMSDTTEKVAVPCDRGVGNWHSRYVTRLKLFGANVKQPADVFPYNVDRSLSI